MSPKKRPSNPRAGDEKNGPRKMTAPKEVKGDTSSGVSAETPASANQAIPQSAFPIVGIGASAGGLAAYEAFFSGIPAGQETGMAFVLVQHLAPDHKSMLGELVRRYAKMQVHEVEDGMPVEPNHAYIIPPNRSMALEAGRLRLFAPSEPRGHRLPIDSFFRSLAREQHERAICIVLSGSGSDGTLGVRAVKGEGGMAMAQDPTTTEHDGMPTSAIATGLVDYVLPPSQMPAQLMAYARHAFDKAEPVSRPEKADGGTLKRLTSLLRTHTGHDFSQYKTTTLYRRMERRMALHQIVDHEDYFRFARESPAETEGLFRDLLIGVTNFFRDPEAFKVLEEQLIPQLLKEKAAHDQFRVWVCGCSTGEEAYSIAILLCEQLEASKRAIKVQVFATDIDHLAIEQARAGIFPSSIAADVSPERLKRFFTHDADRDMYRVQKTIRDMLVFSEQDVIKDPPFSRLDLISCRNLLIYLNSEMQRRLIPLFHYALNQGGALFLGNSETVGEFSGLFSALDRKWKVYVREAAEPQSTRPGFGEFVPPLREKQDRHRPVFGLSPLDPASSWRSLTEQALLSHYAQAGVLINGRGDILHILGRTGQYLEPASGDAALNVLAMAREGLKRELTTALHRAVSQKKPVEYKTLRVKANGDYVVANLTIRPVDVAHGGSSDLYLVVLEEVQAPEESGSKSASASITDESSRITELEHELKAKDDYLQSTLEEMETTNEELKSTNEEMQSINEELQSTNEELETSKEELQSVNEELSTVNAELQDKVADLSRVNNDMNNLLAGTGVGTIFVDNQLRILRFTPAATQVINLIPSDVGRPVGHIVSNLVGHQTLTDDARTVLETLLPKEAEVFTKSGSWYLMRIRPYRTMENAIQGVVLTFVDISERKRAEEKLRESEGRFHAIFNQAFAGVVQMALSGEFTFVNDRFCEMLGYSREDLLAMSSLELTHPDDAQRYRVFLEALANGGPDFSIEKRYRRRDGTFAWVADRVSGIRDDTNKTTSAVAISIDLSTRKSLEKEAATVDARLTLELDALSRLEHIHSLTLLEANRKAVLDEILATAIAINQADMATIQLVKPNDSRLATAAQRGLENSFTEYLDHDGDGTQFPKGERVTVEDVTKSPLFVNTPALAVYLNQGVRALQSVPLVTRGGAVVGALVTYYRAPNRSDSRKLRMFDILAQQVAEILERSEGPPPAPSANRSHRRLPNGVNKG